MRLLQIDAFTAYAFRGNPAAVCLLDRDVDDVWMQNVAAEMNLSETAFLRRRDDGDWSLRWFTPTIEVDLCGHATLASAHALWEEGLLAANETARFHTRSGLLTAQRDNDRIELNFPTMPEQPAPPPDSLAAALGATPLYVGRNQFDLIVELASEEEIRALRPNMALLATIAVRGVIVTSRGASAGIDFVSRFFGPASGVDEDPVTGSAHCALAPFWSSRLGKTSFIARQVSPRGGELRVILEGDRVRLAGSAVTVFSGELAV